MLGGIFGDIVGSVYEFHNTHDYDFRLLSRWSVPTDDTCMMLAVAKALMETEGEEDDVIKEALVREMQTFGRMYPDAGYGGMFRRWLRSNDPKPYNSFGNGSAMRVVPVGWMYESLDDVLHYAKVSAEVTHNHPEGIKGAQAIAACIWLARHGSTKEEIRSYVEEIFDYDLSRRLDEIRRHYAFYETCQRSVPEAIIAFLEGCGYEDVIRRAVSLGGDSDTIADMAGAIAEAYYGMPSLLKEEAISRLDPFQREIVHEFEQFIQEHAPTVVE